MSMSKRIFLVLAIVECAVWIPLVATNGRPQAPASPAAAAKVAPPPVPAKAAAAAAAATTPPDAQAFVKQYCVSCHNERNKGAVLGFTLDTADATVAGEHGEIWEKVV